MTNYRRAVKYRPALALDKLETKQRNRSLTREEDVRGHLIRVPFPAGDVVVIPVEQLSASWNCIVVSGRTLMPMIAVEDEVLLNAGRLLTDKQLWDTPTLDDIDRRFFGRKQIQGSLFGVDDLIVVPVCRADDGWDCVVAGGEKPLEQNPYFVNVHEAVLAGAQRVLTNAELADVPSPNPPRFVPRGCEDLLPLATEFTILPAGAVPGEPDLEAYSVRLIWRGPNQWDVDWIGYCWGPDGWTDEFPAVHRYPLQEAARIARGQVDKLELNGMTWAMIRSQRG